MELSDLIASMRNARVVDLSQTLEERMPNFPTHSKFFHNLWGSYQLGGRSLSYQVLMHEHNGTHVDAPVHFVSDRNPDAHKTIDQIGPGHLIGRGVRLDCRGLKEGGYVSARFIQDWEVQHDVIGADDIVLFNFGWSAHWGLSPDNRRYLNDWPGVSVGAAEYLVSKSVVAVGVDSLSPDPPAALDTRPIHPLLLEKEVLIIENLTRLDELPDFFLFLALPLKIRQGSGSPIRAIALVPGAE
ncbi:MAG: cyclase family protein [Acidobacteria bacterium]|nr:MAG: cyclase family protein [Acidobacteriota bacterium]